jgi:hypothetical protein
MNDPGTGPFPPKAWDTGSKETATILPWKVTRNGNPHVHQHLEQPDPLDMFPLRRVRREHHEPHGLARSRSGLMGTDPISAFLAKLEKAHAARQQRKLQAIHVDEVSGVDHPAHLRPGWLVQKSAGTRHDHRVDRHYLTGEEEATADGLHMTKSLAPGQSVPVSDDGSLNRETCGCLSLSSKTRTEQTAFEKHLDSRFEKDADRYSPADIAFLLDGDGPK